MPSRRKPLTLNVVEVSPDQAWDCERCDRRKVIAYLVVPGEELTMGFCQRCLGIEVKALMSR